MQARKHPGDAWLRWNYLILELQEAICLGSRPPDKQEIGPWTGNFDFRIKFPTWTKNLRKVPAEWTQEGPLGGPFGVLTFGCGFNGVAGVASPGTYQWAEFNQFVSPCLKNPNAHWGLEKQGDSAPALPGGSIRCLVAMEPPYFGTLVDFSQARWTPATFEFSTNFWLELTGPVPWYNTVVNSRSIQ